MAGSLHSSTHNQRYILKVAGYGPSLRMCGAQVMLEVTPLDSTGCVRPCHYDALHADQLHAAWAMQPTPQANPQEGGHCPKLGARKGRTTTRSPALTE